MAMKNTKKAKVALIEINESALCVKMKICSPEPKVHGFLQRSIQ